jgi:hypothetical protein
VKNKLVIIILIIALSIITINLFNYKSDDCSKKTFYFSSTEDRSPKLSEIVEKANKCLYEQRAVFTIPAINQRLIKRVFKINLENFFVDIIKFGYSMYTNLFFTNSDFPYGGIILYDYNFSSDIKDDTKLVQHLIDSKTRNLNFYNRVTNSLYKVSIKPYIFADCVPFNVPHVYCRGMNLAKNDPKFQPNMKFEYEADLAASYIEYIKFYLDIGIDSALGPVVDLDKNSSSVDIANMSDYAQQVSLLMHAKGFIPTLKHFSYDDTIADSHYEFSINEISFDELLNVLTPYKKVNELNMPFMIMTTHQAIAPLDNINPATQSKVVYEFIKDTYPNSMVIADSISMEGMLGDNYYLKLINGEADNFIIHLGLYFPMINMSNSVMALNEMSSDKEAIYRVLKNKQMYNKIHIKKVDEYEGS